MNEIDRCREQIDRIDRDIQQLFEERMSVSEKIGRIKAENGKPVLDEAREAALIRCLRERASSADNADGIERVYRVILEASRRRQTEEAR